MKKDSKSKTIVLTELQHKSIEENSKSKLQAFQRKIYLKAKQNPKYKFYCLYDKVFRKDFLLEAYSRVKANRGKGGVDGMEFNHLEGDDNIETKEMFLEQIHQELRELRYKPSQLREVRIPKSNGKERILRIPTIKDRVVQMVIKLVIEPIFESTFKDCSYGYRPNKSAHDAVSKLSGELFRQMYKPEKGQKQVKSIDFSDCFNTIPQRELIELIAKRIIDRQLLKTIKEILKTGIMKEGNKDDEKRGTPQGGVLSPLLSNIYLDKVDEYWESKENDIKNRSIIRYADDIILLLDDKENKKYDKFIEYLENNLKLTVNKEKSKTESLKEGIDYLGFELKEKVSKRKKKYVATEPNKEAMKRIRSKIRLTTDRKRNSRIKTEDIVDNLNSILRGWQQYYDNIAMGKTREKINWYTSYRVAKLISKRKKKKYICWKFFKDRALYAKYNLHHLKSLGRKFA